MKRAAALAFAGLLPLTAGCTQPAGMYQDARVRVDGPHICFSVNDTEETHRTPPKVTGITVSKRTGAGTVEVWGLNLARAKPAVNLRPEDCIPYGYRPPQYAKPKSTYALRPGERYSVDINSFIKNPSPRGDKLLNRMYSSDFCLVSDPQGRTRIIIVPWGRGAPDWNVCGPLSAT